MSKKKLILIPALLLALTSCGPTTSAPTTDPTTDPTTSEPTTNPTDPTTNPTDPTTPVEAVVTAVEITNKAEFEGVWMVGSEDKNVNYKITYSDGTTKARGAEITSSDTNVVSLPGGIKVHAAGKGTATITVTAGEFSDSVTVTVDEMNKEETVTVAELLTKPVNDATAYIVTGYIVAWQSGKTDATAYGNFYIADSADATDKDGILVYGATEHADSLKYDETTKVWSWGNPNSEDPKRPFPLENYKIGDKVTMKGLRLDYNDVKEFEGVITEHVPVQKDPVTAIEFTNKVTSLGNGYSYTFKAVDNNQDEDVTYSITGDAATLDGSTLVADATKTGTVTVTATSKTNTEVSASVDVTIVANPEIIDATLEQVINDEGTKGAKLFRITAKTVANASTKDGDQYGNFDYTDGTNTITSYGLSSSNSVISYYNDVWNFKNDKTFQNTGVEVGSDKEYTVVVMRSDYKGTKQLVGYIEKEYEPVYEDTTVADLLNKTVSTTVAYNVKAYITGYQYDDSANAGQYGNFRIADTKDSSTNILVYGASFDTEKLAFNKKNGEFTMGGTKGFNPDTVMIGDYVEMTVLRTEYKGTAQCTGIITKIEAVRPEHISLIGAFNSWNGDVDLTSENGKVWVIEEHVFEADTEFKLRRDHRWSDGVEYIGYDWGYDCVKKGADLVTNASGNIGIKAGTYTITFNFETLAIEIVEIIKEVGAYTATKSVADLITEYGWTNTTTKQSFNLDDNVSVKIDGGSNTGKAYDGNHIRIYATDTPAGTITISVKEGYELASITISTVTGTYAFLYVDGTTTDISNVETAVSGSSVKLNSVKNGSNGKQVRVTAFSVTYKAI